MSRIYAAYSVGGLVGPALGAIGGVRGPFLAYLALVALALPLVVAVGTPPRRRRFETDRGALRLPGFWLACAGVLFAILALGMIEGVLPLRLAGWFDQAQIGWLYTGMALLLAAGAAGAAPLFLAGLAVAAVGVGVGETGSTAVLLAAFSRASRPAR
jgi:hypothetical protein